MIGRPLHSMFIGGGTPSVFSAAGIKQILDGVKNELAVSADLEVTMEANPGTFEAERFTGYVAAGVTRFSIGVQTFQAAQLSALGRIHNAAEAVTAAKLAATLPLQSFNLDLMHGLPGKVSPMPWKI
ncbi:YggW family oxidoreductase [Alishewanella longhuensis]